MQVIDYHPQHLAPLTEIYNNLVRYVPHCFPIEPEDLARAFAGERGSTGGDDLCDETVLVSVEDGNPVGFAHVGEGVLQENRSPDAEAVIRFLAYPRGSRDVGQALLDMAKVWAESRQLPAITAYPQVYRYPFYGFAHAYVSGHLEHIQALFQMNGFEQNGGEVFLDWLDFDPPPLRDTPSFDFELTTEHVQRHGPLPDIRLVARQGETQIGECLLWGASRFAHSDDVDDLAFCQWLGIEEPFQGKGLGAYLLAAALHEAKRTGYRHAGISTAFHNHRALLFYSNFGYQAVDWTRRFRRQV